ncbi:MAG: hypothetical protein FWE37_07150 [Spirochaetaceae bacterium]|nr:hypothetical protein [Spirochaetaceae bacterium]
MQIFQWQDGNVWQGRPLKLALGGFDAVHLGHRSILNQADAVAYFRVLPAEIFGANFKGYLRSEEQRLQIFKELGLKALLTIDFSANISKMSGEQFLTALYCQLPFTTLITGEGFRLGYKREWGRAEITVWAANRSSNYLVMPLTQLKGQQVSSSHIRQLVLQGHFNLAKQLLGGKSYSLSLTGLPNCHKDGEVVYNLNNVKQVVPPAGCYSSEQGRVLLKDKNLYITNKTDEIVFY